MSILFFHVGHEFQAIFLSLENDGMNIKSLFNPFVFNTVITRAKFYVVAIGFLEEVKQLELTTLFHPDRGSNTTQCWHEYLKLCEKQGTLRLFDIRYVLLMQYNYFSVYFLLLVTHCCLIKYLVSVSSIHVVFRRKTEFRNK